MLLPLKGPEGQEEGGDARTTGSNDHQATITKQSSPANASITIKELGDVNLALLSLKDPEGQAEGGDARTTVSNHHRATSTRQSLPENASIKNLRDVKSSAPVT